MDTLHLPCFSVEAYSELLQTSKMECFCVSRTTSSIQTNGYCHHFFIQIAVMCLATFCFILSNVLVVTVKLVWLLLLKYFHSTCSNADQISVRLTRVKRNYVKCPTVVLTSPTSYTVFLLDVRFAVESSRVPFFATVCL